MLRAAPHRGSAIRVVETVRGAVGVSGDDGVRGVARLGETALAFAGVIDDIVDVALDPASDGDAVAMVLLHEMSRTDVASVARRLRGSYAIAVVSPSEMVFFRDHLGFAPLFQRSRPDDAWVATEAKQVVAGAGLRREPDMDAVTSVFLGATSDATPSALAGVDRVPRMTFVRAGRDGVSTQLYWYPESLLETSSMTVEEYREEFAARMDRAVRRMLRGPDAISLSGGVDSPLVASFAAPAHTAMFGSPLASVSNVYPDQPSVDERPYIEAVAEALGMPAHTMVPTALPTDDIERWVDLFDGPYPVVSVSESTEFYGWARRLGYEVVLTGELAEYLTEMSTHTLGHLLLTGRLGELAVAMRRERARQVPYGRIVKRTLKSSLPTSLWRRSRSITAAARARRRPQWMTDAPVEDASTSHARTRWQAEQLSFLAGSGVLLEAHDTVTALSRVDVRRPFADIDLWESTLALRAEVKHCDLSRKALLRYCARGRVPDVILDRRDKTVFDESLLARIDYDALQRWLGRPRHRLPWIDYDLLNQRIDGRSIDLLEFMWMKDLAAVHAFLDQW
jgi:asparagine synthase (glutamine-hydrolysing)